jgi:hypothetical protein
MRSFFPLCTLYMLLQPLPGLAAGSSGLLVLIARKHARLAADSNDPRAAK